MSAEGREESAVGREEKRGRRKEGERECEVNSVVKREDFWTIVTRLT